MSRDPHGPHLTITRAELIRRVREVHECEGVPVAPEVERVLETTKTVATGTAYRYEGTPRCVLDQAYGVRNATEGDDYSFNLALALDRELAAAREGHATLTVVDE